MLGGPKCSQERGDYWCPHNKRANCLDGHRPLKPERVQGAIGGGLRKLEDAETRADRAQPYTVPKPHHQTYAQRCGGISGRDNTDYQKERRAQIEPIRREQQSPPPSSGYDKPADKGIESIDGSAIRTSRSGGRSIQSRVAILTREASWDDGAGEAHVSD